MTLEQLKPHIQLVRRHIATRGGDQLWAKLEIVWSGVVDKAKGIVADYNTGRPMFRNEVQAAKTLVDVAAVVPARRVIEVVAAIMILWERDPRAFRSDRAAWVQTARRFRNLSEVACVKYWNAAQGRTKRVYRNFPRLAGETLGKMLMEGLGGIGLSITKGEETIRKMLTEAKAEVYAALTIPQ